MCGVQQLWLVLSMKCERPIFLGPQIRVRIVQIVSIVQIDHKKGSAKAASTVLGTDPVLQEGHTL
jgi:hypothetical protein